VWAAQTVPNTWPILCHCEIVTTRALPARFTTGRSQMTRLTSPRHSYTNSSPRTLRHNRLHNHLSCASGVSSTIDFVSLCFRILHKFWFCLTHASNIPLFSRLPQNQPKKNSPNSVQRIHLKTTQVLPSGATWLLEGARHSSSASESHRSSFSSCLQICLPWL
jgi:hypothetical protein